MFYWIFSSWDSAILADEMSIEQFPIMAKGGAAAAPDRALDSAAALGKQRSLFASLSALPAVLVALSASFSRHDREQVENFISATAVRHEFIETSEFDNPRYVANNADRCYHCKDELFAQMDALARTRGVPAIAYGINADDTRDFRPGHRAAREHHVLAPLLDAQLHKDEIRFLSQQAGLATWDRPASACLSSRVPYGTAVTAELMDKIDRAEAALRALDFRQFRVRAFGEMARVELAQDEMARGFEPAMTAAIAEGVKRAGFDTVTLDPEGYRQGSLNSLLKKH